MFATQLQQLAQARPSSPPIGDAPSPATAALPGGRKRWRVRPTPPGRLGSIGLPELVARILEVRGVSNRHEVEVFLGGREEPPSDAFLIPGFEKALLRLRPPLTIASDRRLRRLRRGRHHLDSDPHRDSARPRRQGAALHPPQGAGGLRPKQPRHRTAGSRGRPSHRHLRLRDELDSRIDHARALGVDVVVVDHHVPPPVLPAASALLNPKLRGSENPFEFATAGLAFRLAEALYDAAGRAFPEARYLDLATLGTIADMVPLVGENRALVRRGLAAIGASERPGLKALMSVSNVKPREVTAESVGFGLAPRLNAAGRLDDARLALDLLLAEDDAAAAELAARIDGLNRERQRLTREGQVAAEAMFRDKLAGAGNDLPIAVLGHPDFHKGVVGLIASRIVEVFGRPAAIYQVGENESRGSCRSIAPYDIVGGLASCGELFARFGGHRQAAGFTIGNDQLLAMEERLVEHAGEALAGYDLTPTLDVDAEWPLAGLRSQEIRFLGKLAPHGMANPGVTLLSRNITAVDSSLVGSDKRHLRLKLKDGNATWSAIAFDWSGEMPAPGSSNRRRLLAVIRPLRPERGRHGGRPPAFAPRSRVQPLGVGLRRCQGRESAKQSRELSRACRSCPGATTTAARPGFEPGRPLTAGRNEKAPDCNS